MKNSRRISIVIFATVFAFVAAGCSARSVAREQGKTYQLVVLHTNDHHGQVLAKADGRGGLASQATFVKQVRAAYENVLLLSAGDINTGMVFSNVFNAEPDIVAYNKMGYEAMTLGNHEFDGSLSVLQTQMKIADFPFLSANIKQGKKYFAKPYIIKNYEGFRVAIIGLTTLTTLIKETPDKSLTFYDEIATAKEMVQRVRQKEKADIVIVLGHLGDIEEIKDQTTSIKLAEAVDGIDLIIDGHSHSYFAAPKVVRGTPIVTASSQGMVVGEGLLKIRDGALIGFDWKPVNINTTAFPPDSDMVATLQTYIDKADASLKDVMVHLTAPFEFGNKLPRYKETASGDAVADSMAWYVRTSKGVDVDFALTNGGGIRSDLPAGDVIREQILTMLPFENYVYVLTLKGSDVIDLFNFIGTVRQGAGTFAQVSKEVRYTITYDSDGNGTISDVTIGGAAIDPNKVYRIATNDYMANGGDGYTALTKAIDSYSTRLIMSDVFIDYMQTFDTFTPATDGRITIVNGK